MFYSNIIKLLCLLSQSRSTKSGASYYFGITVKFNNCEFLEAKIIIFNINSDFLYYWNLSDTNL